jgi:hypothetical protein
MMSDPHQAMQIAWMQTWQMQATQIARMQGRCEAMPVDMGWPHALNFEGEVYEYARTQAMQIAWMQGRCEAMTDDMSWPHAFNVEGEVNENAGQDGFLDLQIYREVPAAQAWGRHVKSRGVDEYRRKDGNTEVRSRLVAMEFNLYIRDDVNASTPPLAAISAVIRMAASKSARFLAVYDVSVAFFHASITGVAADSNDYINYETDTGKLFYDADGNGSGAAVLFATLSGAPALSNLDIFVT